MPYKDKQKQKEYQKKHYLDNKETYAARSKEWREGLYTKLKEYKSTLACLYCGKQGCIDFHHNGDKTDTVSNIIRRHSWERTLEEIKKCDAVCVNCHRKLHKRNGQKYLEDTDDPILQNKREMTRWFYEYKSKLKCEICGETESCCLDFHHKKDKIEIVAVCASKGWSKKRILEEIDKCIILCGNCHRELHDERGIVDYAQITRKV